MGFQHSALLRGSTWSCRSCWRWVQMPNASALLVSKWPFHSRFLKFLQGLHVRAFFGRPTLVRRYWYRKQSLRRQWISMIQIHQKLSSLWLNRTQFFRWCLLSRNRISFFQTEDLGPSASKEKEMGDSCSAALESLCTRSAHRHPVNCLFHQANVGAWSNVDLPIIPQVWWPHESFSDGPPFFITNRLNFCWSFQNL